MSIDTTLYYDSANIGSVKKITNKKVCAIVVFVSGEGYEWTSKNKKKILKRDKSAYEKLKKELQNFNIDLNIHFEIFNLENDFKIDSFVDFRKQKSLPKNPTIKNHKYKSANAVKIWDFYINSDINFFKSKEYLNYDGGYFIIMHHEGLGNTTASPDIIGLKKESAKLPEYITIFEYNTDYKKNEKFVTSHEILHLFGAWDLYNIEPYGFGNENYNFIKNKYPKSIMRKSDEITIDPLTAWRIGLNNNPEKFFLEKVPKAYHKSSYDKNGNYIGN